MVTLPTVGFVGLGQMGSAMVGRLRDVGVDVVVCDLDPARVAAAVAQGCVACATPVEVAERSRLVSVCVASGPQVESVVLGDSGLAAAGRGDGEVLVHSTVAPGDVVGLSDRAGDVGWRVADACVAGGSAAAVTGELVTLVGGLGGLSEEAQSLLATYASLVVAAGPVGSGAALKLAVNVMTYAQFAAASTAMDLVRSAGGDTDALVATWEHTGQLGDLTRQFLPLLDIPAHHLTGAFRTSLEGTVSIARKDLDLAEAQFDEPTTRRTEFLASLSGAMGEVFGLGVGTGTDAGSQGGDGRGS